MLTVRGGATNADVGLINDPDVSHADADSCAGVYDATLFCGAGRKHVFCARLVLLDDIKRACDVELSGEGQRNRCVANDDGFRRYANGQEEERSKRCSGEHSAS